MEYIVGVGRDMGNRLGPTGNRTYVYVFLTIALFVVLIACINFMNLATARSASRAREVGIRKALGSQQDFAYHAGVSGWVFVAAAAAALTVALGTVSLLAIRAAVADPVRSLRYE